MRYNSSESRTLAAPIEPLEEPLSEPLQEPRREPPSFLGSSDPKFPKTNAPEAGGEGALQEKTPRKGKRRAGSDAEVADPRFQKFYKSYPLKRNRPDAAKAFAEIDPSDELLETILAAVARQKQWPDWIKDNGRYIKHPAAWLRAEGWDDQLPEVSSNVTHKPVIFHDRNAEPLPQRAGTRP